MRVRERKKERGELTSEAEGKERDKGEREREESGDKELRNGNSMER